MITYHQMTLADVFTEIQEIAIDLFGLAAVTAVVVSLIAPPSRLDVALPKELADDV